jgi:hypothetical protein
MRFLKAGSWIDGLLKEQRNYQPKRLRSDALVGGARFERTKWFTSATSAGFIFALPWSQLRHLV